MEGATIDEDDVASIYILKADSFGYVNKVMHHYMINNSSMSFAYSYRAYINERKECANYTVNEARRLGLYSSFKQELDYFNYFYGEYSSISAITKENKFDDLKDLIKYDKENIWNKDNTYFLEKLGRGEWVHLLSLYLSSEEEFFKCYYGAFEDYYKNRDTKITTFFEKNKARLSSMAFYGAGRRFRTMAKLFPDYIGSITNSV